MQLLSSLGMSWKSSWLDAWKQLCLLKQQHGRIQVQQLKKSKRLIPLYIWLRNQRMMQLDGSLGTPMNEPQSTNPTP